MKNYKKTQISLSEKIVAAHIVSNFIRTCSKRNLILSSGARYLLVILGTYMGNKIFCFPSQRTLQDNLNVSVSTIVRYTKELVQKNILTITKTKKSGREHNTYTLSNYVLECNSYTYELSKTPSNLWPTPVNLEGVPPHHDRLPPSQCSSNISSNISINNNIYPENSCENLPISDFDCGINFATQKIEDKNEFKEYEHQDIEIHISSIQDEFEYVIPDEKPKTKPEQLVMSDVEEIFENWRKVHNEPDAKLLNSRKKQIKWAIKNYGKENALLAVSGILHDSYFMGAHKNNNVKLNDLHYIFSNEHQIEKFIKLEKDYRIRKIYMTPAIQEIQVIQEKSVEPEFSSIQFEKNKAKWKQLISDFTRDKKYNLSAVN